jgi:hypothetical protein
MSSYSDGNFTIAAASGGKHRVFPFDGDTDSYVTTQDFIQLAANYRPLPLNSADPTDPTCFLVNESERRDIGGELVQWTRTYSRIPKQRNEYESFTYTFPGFGITWGTQFFLPWAGAPTLGTIPVVVDPGRIPITLRVTSRLQHDFFLVGATGQYAAPNAIPVIAAQRYVHGSAFGANAGGDVPDRILWNATNWTVPTIADFKALIAAGAEIVAEDSDLRRWRGNIYLRVTRYIKAH